MPTRHDDPLSVPPVTSTRPLTSVPGARSDTPTQPGTVTQLGDTELGTSGRKSPTTTTGADKPADGERRDCLFCFNVQSRDGPARACLFCFNVQSRDGPARDCLSCFNVQSRDGTALCCCNVQSRDGTALFQHNEILTGLLYCFGWVLFYIEHIQVGPLCQ